MGKIVLVLGPHGVGKTTLFNYARKQNEMIVFDGFQIPVKNLDLSIPEQFCLYQEKYIDLIRENNLEIKQSNKNGFVNRSIEESSYYYYFHTKKDEVFEHYNYIFEQFKDSKVDLIIYLDAKRNVLEERYLNDKHRDLEETLEWYRNEYSMYEEYWKNYDNVKVVNTENKSTEELYDEIQTILTCAER